MSLSAGSEDDGIEHNHTSTGGRYIGVVFPLSFITENDPKGSSILHPQCRLWDFNPNGCHWSGSAISLEL